MSYLPSIYYGILNERGILSCNSMKATISIRMLCFFWGIVCISIFLAKYAKISFSYILILYLIYVLLSTGILGLARHELILDQDLYFSSEDSSLACKIYYNNSIDSFTYTNNNTNNIEYGFPEILINNCDKINYIGLEYNETNDFLPTSNITSKYKCFEYLVYARYYESWFCIFHILIILLTFHFIFGISQTSLIQKNNLDITLQLICKIIIIMNVILLAVTLFHFLGEKRVYQFLSK